METKRGIEIVDMTQEFEKKFAEIKTRDTYHIETAKLEFADEIYDRMEKLGLNQTQLAEKLGLSKQYVSKLLSGYANPSIATMVKVARRLDCKFAPRLEPKVESISKLWNSNEFTNKPEKVNGLAISNAISASWYQHAAKKMKITISENKDDELPTAA